MTKEDRRLMSNKAISLVTGGAGFIGSHVVDYLLKRGHKVVAIDDLSGGFRSNINKKSEFMHCSVNDEMRLKKIFKKHKFDYVYHLAAYAAEGLSHFIRKFNYENNVIGSINLINLAVRNKVKHFVFTSSIAVYGTNQTPMIESLRPNPEDPYGIAKLAVELDLLAAQEMFGLNFTIFRPHNVYGERQNLSDYYRNVLGIFINKVLRGQAMTIFGDGKQTRAFSYIGDVAPHIAGAPMIPKAKNEIFNIGADTPYAVAEVANKIASIVKTKPKITYLPKRKEVVHAFCDHAKFKKVFRIKKEKSLDDGIKRMIAWAKTIEINQAKKFANIEITTHMPPSWKKLT